MATAFNNIDIFVTNADEKQMKMKMVVTADYGNHKWMINEDGGYHRLWQPQMNVKCLWAWGTEFFMKIIFEVAVGYTDN